MPSAYAPPELVKYALIEGVGGQCTPSNGAAECQCDCVGAGGCASVCDAVLTGCLACSPTLCAPCGGGTCDPFGGGNCSPFC